MSWEGISQEVVGHLAWAGGRELRREVGEWVPLALNSFPGLAPDAALPGEKGAGGRGHC